MDATVVTEAIESLLQSEWGKSHLEKFGISEESARETLNSMMPLIMSKLGDNPDPSSIQEELKNMVSGGSSGVLDTVKNLFK